MNQIFFHLSSLSSVNWQVKLFPPLWNCNIQIRSVKADLVFNSKFYMYFGYSLNRGMLQALQSLPFLLILSHFIQITMYDFIQFSCFKHWNLHAVTIRPNPKASPANTDNLQFLLHAVLALLQVSLHSFRHASMCFFSVSWEEEKEWRKRIKK